MDKHEQAIRKANDMVVRGGILGFIDAAEEAVPEDGELAKLKPGLRAAKRAALGAQRAAWVVEQILGQLRIGNPVFRLLAGVVVGVVYLIVKLVYDLHQACLRRRRNQRARGAKLTKLALSPVQLAA